MDETLAELFMNPHVKFEEHDGNLRAVRNTKGFEQSRQLCRRTRVLVHVTESVRARRHTRRHRDPLNTEVRLSVGEWVISNERDRMPSCGRLEALKLLLTVYGNRREEYKQLCWIRCVFEDVAREAAR